MKKNVKKISDYLSNLNLVVAIANENAEDGMSILIELINKAMDRFAPEHTVPVSNNRALKESWMTQSLLKCSNKQLLLYQRYLSNHTEANLLKYKQYHNSYQRLKRYCRNNSILRNVSNSNQIVKNYGK